MKIIALTFLILLIAQPVYSEINLIQSTLIGYTQYGSVESAIPFDYDDDGDYDFLAAQFDDNSSASHIYYYENTDSGFQAFPIGPDDYLTTFVDVLDIDQDGDMDVVAFGVNLEPWTNMAIIFRNEGNNTFSEIVIELMEGTRRFQVIDIDVDGDLDIVSANSSQVYYMENIDGYISTTSTSIHIDANNRISSEGIDFADFDNDNDIDFIAYLDDHTGPDHFYLYLNEGNMEFTTSQTSEPYDSNFPTIDIFDVDSDFDLDFICIGQNFGNGEFVWWENQDNHFIRQTLYNAEWFSVPIVSNAADFDNDGDLDLLADNKEDARITIFENNGNAEFPTYHEINGTSSAIETWILDYDSDGDFDLITVRPNLKLYRNGTVNAVDQHDPPFQYELLSVYPNPFNASANISIVTKKAGNLEISLYNLLGQQVMTITNDYYLPGKHFLSLDGHQLNSGSYFVQAKTSVGNVQNTKIILVK